MNINRKLQRFLESSLTASNYIKKNISEGVLFEDLEHLESIRDWIVEESGFNKEQVHNSLKEFYERYSKNPNTEKSLLENLLLREYRIRIDKKKL